LLSSFSHSSLHSHLFSPLRLVAILIRLSMLLLLLFSLLLSVPSESRKVQRPPEGFDTGPSSENQRGTELTPPGRANLTQCMGNTIRWCFAGNSCFDGEARVDHTSIRELESEERARMATVAGIQFRKGIEECSLGVTIRWIGPWKYHIEYHSGINDTALLPIIIPNLDNMDRRINISGENGAFHLNCAPACHFYINNFQAAYPSIYWSAKFQLEGAGFELARANLMQCFREQMMCFVGNGCADDKGGGNHTHFVELTIEFRRAMNKDRSLLKRVEECDLGVTLRPVKNGTYNLEYHTTSNYSQLLFELPTPNMKRIIEISNDTLSCDPSCEIYDQNQTVDGNNYFWKAKAGFQLVRPTLQHCYKNVSMMCWVGNLCLEGNASGFHEEIIKLDPDVFDSLPEGEWNKTAIFCNVALTMTVPSTKKKGLYPMEYHTTTENMNLPVKIRTTAHGKHVMREMINNNSKIECTPRCVFKQKYKDSDPIYNSHLWSGKIHFRYMTEDEVDEFNETGELKPIPIKTPPKIQSKEQKEEDESNTGTIVIICASALVVCIVVAVVAGTVIQRRQAAKIKRRQDAQLAAAAARNKKNPGSKNNEGRVKNSSKESIPLIKNDLRTEPESEMSDSVKESEKTPKEN
ncbi:hypothetical protein PENTCL1PPCAC_23575, partial [Pristionchus entomophagus]